MLNLKAIADRLRRKTWGELLWGCLGFLFAIGLAISLHFHIEMTKRVMSEPLFPPDVKAGIKKEIKKAAVEFIKEIRDDLK